MDIDDMEGLDEETRKKIEELQKVTRNNSFNVDYASAQLNIGTLLYENNLIDDALEAWNNIKETDSREVFISAQWNISAYLMENEEIRDALDIWRSISQTDDPKIYAQAQWNIGLSFDKNGDIGEAIRIWSYIEKEDSPQVYAVAQLNIGLLLFSMGYVNDAVKIWSVIERYDNPDKYAKAKWMSGLALVTLQQNKKALAEWYEIEASDDSKLFVQAQYKIGEILTEDSGLRDYIKAKQAFNNTEEYFPYEVYCYNKIWGLLNSSFKNIGERVLLLLAKTLEIVDILKLDFTQNFSEEKPPERKLAHYTGTYITNILLEVDKKNKLPSPFRLNTINNVNDPSEGHLLVNYLKDTQENSFYAPDFDKNLHAFISCFTFNHDSLNQFRLYGKEADKEASGVSLVFGKEFFQLDSALGGLSFLSLDNNVQNTNGIISHLEVDEESSVRGSNNRISKQQVMRCVYIDPTSNYVQLAQRNRITFFREYGSDTFELEGIERSKAEYEWKSYKIYIDKKTEAFNEAFIDLKTIYRSIMEEKAKFSKDSSESLDDVDLLTNEILLPLKYLIKHSAFQEEQECRMVYVTSIKAPEVKMVDKRFLFVEYEGKVKENLDKVYIAPAATKYQLYLSWLLRDKDVKIELSNNPYRQM